MKPVIKKSDRKGFKYVCSYGIHECHAETQIEAYNNLMLAAVISVIGEFYKCPKEEQDKGITRQESGDFSISACSAFSCLTEQIKGRTFTLRVFNKGDGSLLRSRLKYCQVAGSVYLYEIGSIVEYRESGFTVVALKDPVDFECPKNQTVWFYE